MFYRGSKVRGFDGFDRCRGSRVRPVRWFDDGLRFDRCRDGDPPGGPHLRTREPLNRTHRTHRTIEPIEPSAPVQTTTIWRLIRQHASMDGRETGASEMARIAPRPWLAAGGQHGEEAEGGPKLRRSCGAMAAHMALLEQYPQYRANQMRLEGATNQRRESGRRPEEGQDRHHQDGRQRRLQHRRAEHLAGADQQPDRGDEQGLPRHESGQVAGRRRLEGAGDRRAASSSSS